MKINEIVGLNDKFIEEGIIMEILRTAYVYAVIIARTFKEWFCRIVRKELLEKRISVLEK